MIQDTRYKHRLDDPPNLRIQVYHTIMDVGGHGMVRIGTHKEQLQRFLQSRLPSYKMTLTS